MTNQRTWVERDDHVQGFIYLILAEGYHGIVPGCVLSRVKIGLTRDMNKRVNDFESNQPSHDIRVLKSIYVEDMASVETALHQEFKHRNVSLKKSREWFDLYPWQLQKCKWLMDQHEKSNYAFSISPKLIAASLIALCGVGLMAHQSINSNQSVKPAYTQASTSPQPIIKIHNRKHK